MASLRTPRRIRAASRVFVLFFCACSADIEGLYAVGDVQQRYHGSCRLGGNGLLAELYGAHLCAEALVGADVEEAKNAKGKTKFKSAEIATKDNWSQCLPKSSIIRSPAVFDSMAMARPT